MPDTREHAKIDFQEDKKKDFKGYTLITGFSGVGLVGIISAKFLIDQLKCTRHGCVSSDIYVPIIRIREGKPVFPTRIFTCDKHKIVIIISEQVIPPKFTDDFAQAIASWAKQKKIKEIISLNAIQIDSPVDEGTVYGLGVDDKTVKILNKFDIKTIKDGVTSGITGLLLLEAKKMKMKAFSIMGNVKLAADYRASAAIVTKLSEVLKLKLDVDPLYEEGKKVEKELKVYLQTVKQQQKKIKQPIQDQKPEDNDFSSAYA